MNWLDKQQTHEGRISATNELKEGRILAYHKGRVLAHNEGRILAHFEKGRILRAIRLNVRDPRSQTYETRWYAKNLQCSKVRALHPAGPFPVPGAQSFKLCTQCAHFFGVLLLLCIGRVHANCTTDGPFHSYLMSVNTRHQAGVEYQKQRGVWSA